MMTKYEMSELKLEHPKNTQACKEVVNLNVLRTSALTSYENSTSLLFYTFIRFLECDKLFAALRF